MVYDVDHDGNPDVVSCQNVGTIKYVSNANWRGYYSQNAGDLDWQYKPVSELDWEFSHRFNENCVIKDCTHSDILTCVMANPSTGGAIGSGCNDWLKHVLVQGAWAWRAARSPPRSPTQQDAA